DISSDLKRKARLARAPRTGQRQEADLLVADTLDELRQLATASDQRVGREGQVRDGARVWVGLELLSCRRCHAGHYGLGGSRCDRPDPACFEQSAVDRFGLR